MKRAITLVTFTQLLFLLFLALSGLTEGTVSEIIYYCGFFLPFLLGIYFIRRQRSEGADTEKVGLKLTRGRILPLIPLLFPTVFTVFLISLLTSLLMRWLGFENSFTVSEGMPLAILIHAVIPAVLEEMLFRYIPLKLLLPYSGRWAVLLSSLFFALIHGSLFQIPYAFVAGLIFALADIYSGSILPSVLLHLTNNVISLIVMLRLQGSEAAVLGCLGILAALSLLAILLKRGSYRDFFKPLKEEGENAEYSLAPLALIIPTVILAITNLF